MLEIPNIRPEMRYGMPAADQILINRHYIVGYSYYFRQPKWALEIVDDAETEVQRKDPFRSDYRIPPMFRVDKEDYEGSGYDRGHLVASANQRGTVLQNSETFLLSNMSPQTPNFNQQIWKALEGKVRDLYLDKSICEVYVISGPIFDFDRKVEVIPAKNADGVTLPIPHKFFKSILTENRRGTFRSWSFIMENKDSDRDLADFLVKATQIEREAGIVLWEKLDGQKIQRMKRRKATKLWKTA